MWVMQTKPGLQSRAESVRLLHNTVPRKDSSFRRCRLMFGAPQKEKKHPDYNKYCNKLQDYTNYFADNDFHKL